MKKWFYLKMVIFYCFNVLKKCKRPTISVPERAIIPYCYHELYVQSDTLLLVDVFEMCLKCNGCNM